MSGRRPTLKTIVPEQLKVTPPQRPLAEEITNLGVCSDCGKRKAEIPAGDGSGWCRPCYRASRRERREG